MMPYSFQDARLNKLDSLIKLQEIGIALVMMSKIEKRLIVAAIVFVAIYLGAAAITIHTRITKEERIERLESPDLSPAEGQLLIAELFLPFMILLTLAVCFIIARKQRIKKLHAMEQEDEAESEVERRSDQVQPPLD
jgi:hypothetical protein